ncbi:MAG TPA: TerC family protein [Bacteroidota bacterium]|nr:TerC family protein [Bacteroidota bacterium]
MNEVFLWVGFNLLVLAMLAVDLGVFHRKAHAVSIREALTWSLVWIVLSLIFNVIVYFWHGKVVALEFLTGYLIEKSLSVDNLFVFLLIFTYFKVPAKYQHKVLFWGIIGALVMRGILILVGTTLINEFHWVIYVFGLFLVFTGIKMAIQKEDAEVHPERNIVVRLFKKIMPVTAGYHEDKFFLKINGKRYATLLFVVLIVVETTDLVFAVDSIPAIFAITTDPFIVYTSNVFAILGLRALYFALAGIMDLFHYLKLGLSIVLTFVGIKMLIVDLYKIPIGISLGVVGGILLLSVLASILWPKPVKIPPIVEANPESKS